MICHTNINTIGEAINLGIEVEEDYHDEYLIPEYVYALLHVKVHMHMTKKMFLEWDDRTTSDIPYENTEGFYLYLARISKKYHEIDENINSILDDNASKATDTVSLNISEATCDRCFARIDKDYKKVGLPNWWKVFHHDGSSLK